MKGITVLVTGGGAPGIAGTIYALKNNLDGRSVRIVTVDSREDVVGKYMSDSFHVIPKADDDGFLEEVLKIVKEEGIDVVLPQVTRELEKFSENSDLFESIGVKVVVMKPEVLKVMNNKYLLMKEFQRLGYNQGKFRILRSKSDLFEFAEEMGYPENDFVVKLAVSNGMRGLRVVTSRKLDLKSFVNEKPSGIFATIDEIAALFDEGELELVGMEYFPGEEYTVDVYRSPLSGKVVVIPRLRSSIRSGITFEGVIERSEELIEKSERLSVHLDASYCFGFQFKRMKNGEFGLLESNPRVQGTMIMSVMAGANMIYWAVKEALGEEVDLDSVKPIWGLKFKRYWGGIGLYPDGRIKERI